MNYFLKCYGCQYNEWDAARIKSTLYHIGFHEASEKEAAVIFVVACAVRQTAVDRMIGKIRNWRRDGKKVIVSGCILDNDRKKLEKDNIACWNNNKPEELIDMLKNCHFDSLRSKGGEILTEDLSTRISSLEMTKLLNNGNASSAFLPIMIGCNNFCTYCAVPYTRGRETSREMDDIISDFKELVSKGHKEITLLGQNVNSYSPPSGGGAEGGGTKPFTILLHQLNSIPGDFVISFTSNHPKDMSDDIIMAVRDLPKVKKEIHLPLQSGSNKILKAMKRPYTKEQYLKLADRIKSMIPEVKILTDVIVGFPGETEEDFQETVDVFRKVGYHIAYNNKYSPRAGTKAFELDDPIPWEEKERRWRILNDISYYKK